MRVGNNPLKNAESHALTQLVLSVITHLPNQEGYHAGRLEVIQTCLRSMIQNAGGQYSLIVWDNGSCSELLDWIADEISPDILVRSKNIGKPSARSALFRMVHPDSIMAYSDDDMYFAPNWLEPQLDLFENFPNVAAVSGYPLRVMFRWGIDKTIEWAKKNASLEVGRFLPDQYEDDYALSVGRDPEWHKGYTEKDQDYRVTYQGRQAYCTSHHCQFIGLAGTISRLLQYDGMALGNEQPFDIALDQIGLRLATTERLARHMGNVIDDRLREEILQNV